ncbi:MAG: transporter substrate-binding domain-containing protein [Myxococcota bacterium]
MRGYLVLVAALAAASCTRERTDSPPAPGQVRLEPVAAAEQIVDTGDLEQIRRRGTLRILVAPQTDDALRRSNGVVRLERELAEHFANRFGVDAQLVEVSAYEELIPELLIGHGDIVAAQMTVTDARSKEVVFTRPVDTVAEIVVSSVDEKDLPTTPAQLDGERIFVPADSAFVESLQTLRGELATGLEIVEVPGPVDVEEIAYDVSRGAKRFTVVDSNRLDVIESYNRKLKRLFPLEEGRQLAWAVRPGNPDLKAAADAFLVEAAMTSHAQKRSLGDLDDLKERGSIRLLTRNNAVSYYLHRGQHLGFDYELTELLAKSLGLRLEVVVPPSRDQLVPWLLDGRGDIIAGGFTVTPDRERQVRFSEPYLFVEEVLVQRADAGIQTAADLRGKTIHIRRSSSFFSSLEKARERLGFVFDFVGEDVETETLVARVAQGEYDFTVADTHILGVEKLVHDGIEGACALDVLTDEELNLNAPLAWEAPGRPGDLGSKEIAFALRPDSTVLLPRVNDFVREHFRGLEYNMLRNRYFGNQRRANEAKLERVGETGVLSDYDALIKKFSARYELDWRLMASLAYQESRFDPKAQSWVGAQGLFQVMPATGRELGFVDLKDPEQSTHAGIKYVSYLIGRFEAHLDFRQRVRFALASYNAGFGHVQDARRLARELGLNPDRWFKNVERAMLLLQQPRYYKRARYGYVRGQEPVNYVSQIQLRYDNYVKLLPR